MPNAIRILSPYIPNGNPDTMAVQIATADPSAMDSNVYASGQLGSSFDYNNKSYTIVVLKAGDSVTPGQALYWNNRANFQVSGALASSDAGINDIAGVVNTTLTAGANGAVICAQNGGAATVQVSAQPAAAGLKMIGSTTGKFVAMAAGIAATDNVYGVFTGVGAAGSAPAILNIPTLP